MFKLEFDPEKNAKNIKERNINFEIVNDFELNTAKIWLDNHKDYGKERYIALGYIKKRLYSLVFTVRGTNLRVISLRKANTREVKYYEKQI
jgi:uncharacterized DUF497 family protein